MRLLLLGLAMVLSGCTPPRSFVDPSYARVGYGDLAKPAEPLKLKLVTQFHRNGGVLPSGDPALRAQVERVLRASGLIEPAAEADGELQVSMNNIADKASGNVITDAYEMRVVLTRNGKSVTRSGLKHVRYTALGDARLPAGTETMTPDAAFARVVEEMLLDALHALQRSGRLSRAHPMWERFLLGRPHHATPIDLGG